MPATVTHNEELGADTLFSIAPAKVSLTLPAKKPEPYTASSSSSARPASKNKVPITVFLSKTAGHAPFGAYVYSVYDFRRAQAGSQPSISDVYTTVITPADQDLLDLATRLSKVLAATFQCPAYVSVSGLVSFEESVAYVKMVVDLVRDKFGKEQ